MLPSVSPSGVSDAPPRLSDVRLRCHRFRRERFFAETVFERGRDPDARFIQRVELFAVVRAGHTAVQDTDGERVCIVARLYDKAVQRHGIHMRCGKVSEICGRFAGEPAHVLQQLHILCAACGDRELFQCDLQIGHIVRQLEERMPVNGLHLLGEPFCARRLFRAPHGHGDERGEQDERYGNGRDFAQERFVLHDRPSSFICRICAARSRA